MRLIDEEFLETPWYGSRQMVRHLRRQGHAVGRKRVRRLMAKMGLAPIYQRPRTTFRIREHRIYPYLLRGPGDRPPQPGLVRGHHLHSDAAGLSVPGGGDGLGDAESARLAAVEHDGRGVLHRRPGGGAGPLRRPEIFNTDQGSQFTSPRFTDVLKDAGVRISMDGRGRWMDNVFIERLWRSLKYECVYLHAFETGSELRAGLTRWIGYYNTARPHSALGGATPDEAYHTIEPTPSPGLAPATASIRLAARTKPGNSLIKPPICPNGRGHLSGIFRQHGRTRRRSHSRLHPKSREGRSEAGADEPLVLTSRLGRLQIQRAASATPYRFERFTS